MGAATNDPSPITLHSSWRAVAGGYVAPLVFLLVAGIASTRQGVGPVVVVVTVVAVGLLAVLLLDYPVATRFDPDGVLRRMPLRHQRLDWDEIRQLTRTRGRLLSSAKFSSNPEVKVNRGGLVAAVGRRRYLLVDQAESRDEFRRLIALLDAVAPELADDALIPPPDAPPTFLYRRARWRPDGPDGR